MVFPSQKHIIFFQQYATPYFGILSLVAHLKNRGIECDVIIESLEKNALDTICRLSPRLIGISVLSTEHRWLSAKIAGLKKALPDSKIIIGGVHAMFYHEKILQDTQADYVCNGEGEMVLPALLAELDKLSPDYTSVPGLTWRGQDGKINANEKAELVLFNDAVIEDKSVYYDRYPSLAHDRTHIFFSSRGCPFRCSFCYNANINDLFFGKGRYMRQKSVANFIKELENEKQRWPSMACVYFYDDLFTFDKVWLMAFLKSYKEKIGLPFLCTSRADALDEAMVKALAGAGCRTVTIGIETGNEERRKKLLNKHVTNEQILSCGQLLKRYGIKSQSTNIFCLPDETVASALDTLELNLKVGIDCAFSALFLPFPKTRLTDYCLEKGYLKPGYSLDDMPNSFLMENVLNMPDKTVICNIHRITYIAVRYPRLYPLLKQLATTPGMVLPLKILFLFGLMLRRQEVQGGSFMSTVLYAWRLRKTL